MAFADAGEKTVVLPQLFEITQRRLPLQDLAYFYTLGETLAVDFDLVVAEGARRCEVTETAIIHVPGNTIDIARDPDTFEQRRSA